MTGSWILVKMISSKVEAQVMKGMQMTNGQIRAQGNFNLYKRSLDLRSVSFLYFIVGRGGTFL